MQNCGEDGFQANSDLDNIDIYLPSESANSYFKINGRFLSDITYQAEVQGGGNLKKVAFYLNDEKKPYATIDKPPFKTVVNTGALSVGQHNLRFVMTGNFFGSEENIERVIQFSTEPEPLDFEKENALYVNFAKMEYLVSDNSTSSSAEVDHLFDDCFKDFSGCMMSNQQNYIELDFDFNEVVSLNKVAVMRSKLRGGEVTEVKLYVKEFEVDDFVEVVSHDYVDLHNWIQTDLENVRGQFARIVLFSSEESELTRSIEVRLLGNLIEDSSSE